MLTSDTIGREKQILREGVKRKLEINTNKCGRKKCTKRMMYWMNEQELVEAALSVLKRDHTQMAAAERRIPLNPELTVIPETDPEETTDSEISEADVDIAEQETLQYSKCLEERRCSSGEQCAASSVVLENESAEEKSWSDSDHEALQVLQEIFFS
ncbi:hypothetical protein C0J45_5067 [Silurus meridionalis]|nr:hypothetical protein C0J45_5067 [Silurus meridionalis]